MQKQRQPGQFNGVPTTHGRRKLMAAHVRAHTSLQLSIKSAILSASKRARLKHSPGRVRFAHAVALANSTQQVCVYMCARVYVLPTHPIPHMIYAQFTECVLATISCPLQAGCLR
jgi:hypothetical protein